VFNRVIVFELQVLGVTSADWSRGIGVQGHTLLGLNIYGQTNLLNQILDKEPCMAVLQI